MHLNFNKISYVILMLFPFGILAGSFFVNLFIFLVVIFFIISLLINKNINFFYNHSYLFFFILSCLITSFSSNYIFHSLKKTLAFSAELIFFMAIFLYILNKDNKKIFQISKIVFCIAIFICLDLWIQWHFGKNIFGYPKFAADRLTSIFGNEPIPGSIIFKFLPFVFYYLFSSDKNSIFYKLKHEILIFIFFSILITGERAASILTMVFILLMTILNYKIIDKKKFLIYVIIIFCLLSIFYKSDRSILKERVTYTINVQIKDNVYEKLFKYALDGFYLNPLFGSGVQTYRYECPKRNQYCSTHPHHYIMELLSDVGLIGVIFLLGFFLKNFKKKILKIKDDLFLKNFIISYLIAIFFPFIPTGSIFSSFSFSISLFSLGFVMSINKFNDSNK